MVELFRLDVIIPSLGVAPTLPGMIDVLNKCQNIGRIYVVTPAQYLHNGCINIQSGIACAVRQRNLGLWASLKSRAASHLLLLDDDVDISVSSLNKLIESYKSRYVSDCFAPELFANNPYRLLMDSHPHRDLATRLLDRLDLYSSATGKVAKSGWQNTKICTSDEEVSVDWIYSAFLIIPANVITRLDCFFQRQGGHHYLEDVEFSFRLSRLSQIIRSGHFHFSTPVVEKSSFPFGIQEVKSRYHLVGQNRYFSWPRFYAMVLLRCLLSMAHSVQYRDKRYFFRACGNVIGLVESLFASCRSRLC